MMMEAGSTSETSVNFFRGTAQHSGRELCSACGAEYIARFYVDVQTRDILSDS
jgi:hypothetical protein